jgi:phosphoglycolate phosphatase
MTLLAIFDLDGTLVDSAPDLHAALDRLMAARGLPPFGRAEVIGMVGDGARALVERALASRGQAFDQAALDALAEAGWRLAVCTNKPEAAARELLSALGLMPRFATLAGGDSVPARKPDPAHLRAVIAAAGCAPDGAVMIGDHRNDVAAARGAGIPCVFVGWGYGPLAMADGAPVAATPESLPAELRAALHRLRP